jgi:hypothetical protein
VLPWEPAALKIGALFQQCKMSNKLLFASGSGMQMLIYYCATSYRHIKVINDLDKNTKLVRSGIKDPVNVILNNDTGDFFEFDSVRVMISVEQE